VKVVMTLLVRDEEEIVDEHLRYHLENGVDFVIATDHRSVDGTTEILRRYEREGYLHLIREEREEYLQPVYVTRMARLAATEFGADWVINADADEFWWPRDGSFEEIFESVPSRFGAVLGFWRHFVLRPDDDRPFFERMVWRRRPSRDPLNPYHPAVKVAHRAHPLVEVMGGNHKVRVPSLATLPDWLPIEVLHFPMRTTTQLARKFTKVPVDGLVRPGRHWVRIAGEIEADGFEKVLAAVLVDDEALAAGLADGSLTHDTRVRDALRRALAGAPSERPPPSLADDFALASEFGDQHPVASAPRLLWRLNGLRGRAAAIEETVTVSLGRAVRSVHSRSAR
jgi:hypothetical protein